MNGGWALFAIYKTKIIDAKSIPFPWNLNWNFPSADCNLNYKLPVLLNCFSFQIDVLLVV